MNLLTRRLRRGELIALDTVFGVGFLVEYLTSVNSVWANVPAAVAIAAPVAVRRIWPLASAVVLWGGLILVEAATQGNGLFALVLVMYTTGLLARGRRAVVGLLIGLPASVVAAVVDPSPTFWLLALLPVDVAAVGAWATGRAVRARREYLAREASHRTERAVAEERMRIARDLHDVVAHSMSLITVQAGVAALAVEARPEAAAEALRSIERTGRASVAEMRGMLGVLRSGSEDLETERAPAPDLDGLPELADGARQAGVRVAMSVTGSADLPDGMALSVYRIVQEALTNVVKHAAPAQCRVDVAVDRGRVTIEVVDDGPGTRVIPGSADGHGLVGMRERVAMYGGRFTAAPRPGGGFRVAASWEVA